MLRGGLAEVTSVLHDAFPHGRDPTIPIIQHSCVAVWWLLRSHLALAPSFFRSVVRTFTGSMRFRCRVISLSSVLVDDPFCKSHNLTALIISGFDHAHRRVRACFFIRSSCEVGKFWGEATRIQSLAQRVVAQSGPLDGRYRRNVGMLDQSNSERHRL